MAGEDSGDLSMPGPPKQSSVGLRDMRSLQIYKQRKKIIRFVFGKHHRAVQSRGYLEWKQRAVLIAIMVSG